jgi:hypothetical protein
MTFSFVIAGFNPAIHAIAQPESPNLEGRPTPVPVAEPPP